MESKNNPYCYKYREFSLRHYVSLRQISYNYAFLKYNDFRVCIAFQEESRDSHRSMRRLRVILYHNSFGDFKNTSD